MLPYQTGKLGRISRLHYKVTHGPQPLEAFTDKEYYQESREIAKLNDAEINLVCEKCFPLREKIQGYGSRTAEKYGIRYPQIKQIYEK